MIDIYKVGAFHQKIHFTYSGIRTGDPRWRTSSSTDTLRTNVVEYRYWKNRKRSRVPVLDDISLSSTGTRRTNGSSPAAVSAVIIIIIIYFSAVLS